MADIRRILDNIDREEIETYINEVDQRLIAVDQDLQNQININKDNIATNEANIEKNTTDIKSNNDLIIANTNNINSLTNIHIEDKEYLENEIANLSEHVKNEDIRLTDYINSENIRTKDELYTYLGTIQRDLISEDTELQNNIDNVSDRLNTLADSDDETLDQLSEIVSYIKNNKDLIDGITTSKTNVTDFNALSERVATAEGEIDTAQANITSLQESYNAIPSWSLEAEKPSYTYDEVGAEADGTAANEVAGHDSDESAHSDIREMIETLINRVEATAKVVELWTGIAVPSTPEEVPSTLEELQAE